MPKPWDTFFKDKVTQIFTEKKLILDIGGGLRILQDKGNRFSPKRAWVQDYLPDVTYQIMDPVPDYNPDIIGDIHHMPFADNTYDAIICLAVLEHVERPVQAFQELHRALKSGGYCFVYVPFLYYYHAEEGYYKDFWRFTHDALIDLAQPFSRYELQNERGAIETAIHLTGMTRFSLLAHLGYFADRITGKVNSKQTSGYYLFLEK